MLLPGMAVKSELCPRWVDVKCGRDAAIALDSAGRVWGVGRNMDGLFGS